MLVIRVILLLTVTLCSCGSEHDYGKATAPNTVQGAILPRSEPSDDSLSDHSSLIAAIENGDASAIDRGVAALGDADAGASLSLKDAIARALLINPRRVLENMLRHGNLAPEDICVPFLSDDDEGQEQLQLLRAIRRSVAAVNSAELTVKKQACLREIDNAMRDVENRSPAR